MARVQRKTKVTIEAEVMGYDEKKKGHLTLTSGYIYYYRPFAKKSNCEVHISTINRIV